MSFQIMQPKIEEFRKSVLRDPAVEYVAGFIGGGRGINNAQVFVRLKPLDERNARPDHRRANPARLTEIPGARLWLNVDQDIRFGGGFGGGSYSTRCGRTALPSFAWAQRVREALKPLPEPTGIEDELVSSQQITPTSTARRRAGSGSR